MTNFVPWDTASHLRLVEALAVEAGRAELSGQRAREDLQDAIVDAAGFGCKAVELAAAAGVSRQRMYQILRQAKEEE